MMHRNREATTEWKIAIKQRLAAQVEHRLMDRFTSKPMYGLRSRLVNRLLEDYLAAHPSPLDAPPLTEAEIDAIKGEDA